jgi:hypothetical protein
MSVGEAKAPPVEAMPNCDSNGNVVTLPDEAEAHGVADSVWNSTKATSKCDEFISHVWAAPWLLKCLVLLTHMNLKYALNTTVATIILVTLGTLWYCNFDVISADLFANPYLPYLFMILPIVVFFVMLAFGQRLTFGKLSKDVWLDKFCIHQTRNALKSQGVPMIGDFVSNCKTMVVVWSGTYFQRLWCAFEIATFSRINGVENVAFMPLWYPPFLLSSIILGLIAGLMQSELMWIVDDVANWTAGHISPACAQIVAVTCVGSGIFLPTLPVYFIMFRYKIHYTKDLFQQFQTFSIRNCKCHFEDDRGKVYQMVNSLWKSHLDPEDQQEKCAIDRFDEYVRTTMLSDVRANIGDVAYIPYYLNVLMHLPSAMMMLMDWFICDGNNCNYSAKMQSFATTEQYMITNALMNSTMVLTVFVLIAPAQLMACSIVDQKVSKAIPKAILQFMLMAFINMFIPFLAGVNNQAWVSWMQGQDFGLSMIVLNCTLNGGLCWYFFIHLAS